MLSAAACGQSPARSADAPPAASAAPSAAALKPGDLAPDFTLPGSDGRTYTLSDYRGRRAVVLAWFAKAFTDG